MIRRISREITKEIGQDNFEEDNSDLILLSPIFMIDENEDLMPTILGEDDTNFEIISGEITPKE